MRVSRGACRTRSPAKNVPERFKLIAEELFLLKKTETVWPGCEELVDYWRVSLIYERELTSNHKSPHADP